LNTYFINAATQVAYIYYRDPKCIPGNEYKYILYDEYNPLSTLVIDGIKLKTFPQTLNDTKLLTVKKIEELNSCKVLETNRNSFYKIIKLDGFTTFKNITKKESFVTSTFVGNQCKYNSTSTISILNVCYQTSSNDYYYSSVNNGIYFENECVGGCLNCTKYKRLNISEVGVCNPLNEVSVKFEYEKNEKKKPFIDTIIYGITFAVVITTPFLIIFISIVITKKFNFFKKKK
jgi:hypothetical protein